MGMMADFFTSRRSAPARGVSMHGGCTAVVSFQLAPAPLPATSPSTDDAYVEAHSVLISPKVSGYISEVPVDDNASVKAGQVLARIDPRDYQTALDQARANVAAAQAGMNTLNQQIGQQKLVIASKTANRSRRIRRLIGPLLPAFRDADSPTVRC
jgi:multidrug resistance efflux pump